MVQAIANEQPLPGLTMDQINEGNAQHAPDFASVGKRETLDLLRSCEQAAAALRKLSDE